MDLSSNQMALEDAIMSNDDSMNKERIPYYDIDELKTLSDLEVIQQVWGEGSEISIVFTVNELEQLQKPTIDKAVV